MDKNHFTQAIRYAVESATVPRSDATGSRSVEEAVFTTEARQRLQRLIQTEKHLCEAQEACTEEMYHQVDERNIDAAYAAICLGERLPRLCVHRRNYVQDADGNLRPLDE
jgi:hypothetical protein